MKRKLFLFKFGDRSTIVVAKNKKKACRYLKGTVDHVPDNPVKLEITAGLTFIGQAIQWGVT